MVNPDGLTLLDTASAVRRETAVTVPPELTLAVTSQSLEGR